MARVALRWVAGVVVAGAGAAVAMRILRSMSGTGSSGGGLFPPIGSDTWPPVPTNPDRPL